MACNTIGAYALLGGTGQKQKPIDRNGQFIIIMFSLIFAANIVVGNASLRYVSVNFNQVLRSLVPALVLGINMLQGKRFSLAKILAVIPIVLGVAAATFGDLNYTYIGGIMTGFCVLLAALKAIASGALLTGEYKLEPFDLLSRMAPLSFVWMVRNPSPRLDEAVLHYSVRHDGRGRGRVRKMGRALRWLRLPSGGFLGTSLGVAERRQLHGQQGHESSHADDCLQRETSPSDRHFHDNLPDGGLVFERYVSHQSPSGPAASIADGICLWRNAGMGIAVVMAGSARYSLVSVREKQLAARQTSSDVVASKV
eukprot:scaffold977_cov253-Pinguiococcus_pyrenoidosus.AAC.12